MRGWEEEIGCDGADEAEGCGSGGTGEMGSVVLTSNHRRAAPESGPRELAMVGCYGSLASSFTHGVIRRRLLSVGTVVTGLLVLLSLGPSSPLADRPPRRIPCACHRRTLV
jgi:hypothetical protein